METNLTEVYLDNSATTRCSERAKDLMVKVLMEDYGNPSSLHMKGVEAENYIKEAKKKIAKTLKVDEKEILFTSGGTEQTIRTDRSSTGKIKEPEIILSRHQ